MKIGFSFRYLVAFLVMFAVIVFIALFMPGGFIRWHFGDILIIVLIYCAVRVVTKVRRGWLPMGIFAFAVLVEIGQYFNLVELLGLGGSRIARIAIGETFDPLDIVMYFIGAVLVFAFDMTNEAVWEKLKQRIGRKKIRNAALIALGLCVLTVAIHVVHALTLDRIMVYREITFTSAHLPQDLDGYTIAFVVDVHAMPHDELAEVVQNINERNVDLLLLGGDFWFRGEHYRQSLEVLSNVVTTDGIFGVEGNHDDYVRLFYAMTDLGMIPLSNSGLHIRDGFFVAGVEDLWNRNPCVATAIEGAAPDDFVLLLAHNPDISMEQDTTGVDLILAGHTHGGQINFFGIWAPYFTFDRGLTAYGQRFVSGWAASRDGISVFVSRGVGIHHYHVPNVFARPQVIFLTLNADLSED